MNIEESDLFPYLRDYFSQDTRNEIFTEVAECGGPRPDIVVRNGKLITVIEMKTSLSMKLLEQAFQWRYRANFIFIAIPEPKNQRINEFVMKILNDYGIGILTIKVQDKQRLDSIDEYYKKNNLEVPERNYAEYVSRYWRSNPKFFRINKDKRYMYFKWEKALKDMYRYENNCNGGNKGGGYNTEYRCMIYDVENFIKHKRNNEWTPIKDILDNVESVEKHYSRPKASLYSALTTIEFKTIESKVIDKKVCFRVKSSKNITA